MFSKIIFIIIFLFFDDDFFFYFRTAFLRTAAGNRLPDNPDNEACLSDPDSGFFCSLAGNGRHRGGGVER